MFIGQKNMEEKRCDGSSIQTITSRLEAMKQGLGRFRIQFNVIQRWTDNINMSDRFEYRDVSGWSLENSKILRLWNERE